MNSDTRLHSRGAWSHG